MELALTAKVDVTQGGIKFYGYEAMLEQARELAENIRSVEVDEESLQTTKKLLAEVNKRVDALEKERIRIKKELLVPYLDFEEQIKSITSVVKESDNELRGKVRELEEIERQEKRGIIERMFVKRLEAYQALFFLTPDRFITAQHLNKAMSLNKVESEMVQWMELRQREYDLIVSTPNADLLKYEQTLDIISSLPPPPVQESPPAVMPAETKYVTLRIDENDLARVHLFFKMNGIEYKKIGG